jgi:hypothetical protein
MRMSHKDLDRIVILKKVMEKELTQIEAGRLLKIGDRQIRKLIVKFQKEGPQGIISKLIGRKGNRNKPNEFKQKVLTLLKEKYEGFGPTLAAEKLLEIEGLKVSNETIRQWMIKNHLWFSRKKRIKLHSPRMRRACFGELIQADGSPHHWFGEDKPEVNATVFIDDATGIITGLFFSETETLEGYFKAFEQHLKRYGRPRALYTDKYAVFRSPKGKGTTQMQIALKELDIELILANSPQAKGRVERANRTLQDRLAKELHLKNIKTIEEANEYAAEYLEIYNKKFSKKPMSEYDAHQSLEGYDLFRILCRKEERSLNLSGIFQFNKVHYQIQGISELRRLNRKKVEIRLNEEKMRVFLANEEIQVLPLNQIMEQPRELNRKELINWQPKEIKITHPWKMRANRETIKKRMAMI